MNISQAHALLWNLKAQLSEITRTDPEQEVRGIAVPALDAVVVGVRELLKDDVIASRVCDVISTEAFAEGEPIRAIDALLVVTTLLGALPQPRSLLARALSRRGL